MGGIEGEGGRFDLTSQQSKPTEQAKPQLEEGNGAPGLPPTIHEQAKPPPESHERQPLPDVLDILERRAQLRESQVRDLYLRHHESKHTREYLALRREHLEKVEELGDEVVSLYPNWTDRDRLIFDLYTTSEEWRYGLSAQKTQQFIARVQPMSEMRLRRELRKAQKAQERKAAIVKKISETQRRNKNLTPEERAMREQEEADKRREKLRILHERVQKNEKALIAREERRRKRLTGGTDTSQPTQVFPPPTQE
jgi:hypothetical protein